MAIDQIDDASELGDSNVADVGAPTAMLETDAQRAKAEHRRILIILGALMLGMVLASLDQTIVATALWTIARKLNGVTYLSWVATSYLLALCISTPLWGKLGDLYGRKKLFQAAIVIFLIGSALSGVSQSMIQLIAFRAIQGVGAGGLMIGAQAIMGDVVSARQRGRYMGYFGAVLGGSSVAGPLIGGYFTQHASWRWVFYINIPIGIIALFVIASVLHIPVRRTHHKIDYWGTVFLSVAVTAVILMVTWGGTTYAWGSGIIIALGVVTAVFVAIFVLVERKAPEPLMPMWLFRTGVFSVSSSVGFIVGFLMFAAIFYIPIYMQTVHNSSPTQAGLQLLPLVIGMLCTFIPSGRLVARYGRYKWFPISGTAVMTVGMYLLSTLTPHTSFVLLSIYMAIVGCGVGLVMQVLVVAVQNAVPYSQLGTATSAATFFRTIGGAFGLALFGAIFIARITPELRAHVPAAVLKHIPIHALLAGGGTVNLSSLPAPIQAGVHVAFSNSLDTAFLVGVPFGVVAFVLSLFLKEVPLREHAFVDAEGTITEHASGEASGHIDAPIL